MGQEFLKTPWPILGFAQFLGMFPCKRICNEDGSIGLKPMNWKVQWALFAGMWLLIGGSGAFLFFLVFSKSPKSSEEIKQCFQEFNGNGSIVDILTTNISGSIVLLGSFVIHFGNCKMKEDLCDFADLLKKTSMKISGSKSFLIVSGLYAPAYICFSLFHAWITSQCLSLNLIDVTPSSIFFLIGSFIGIFPLVIFFILTLEIFSCLVYEIDQFRPPKLNPLYLTALLKLTKILDKVRTFLSPNLFWAMTIVSIQILLMLFFVPSHFINYARNDDPSAFLLAGSMFLLASCYCTLMWFFNTHAHKVTNQVHQLKEDLKDIYVPDQSFMVAYEGQTVPAYFLKDRILDKLTNFAGFDGQGFFVLGKSFLNNFLGFCATYFVILLQFKLSE